MIAMQRSVWDELWGEGFPYYREPMANDDVNPGEQELPEQLVVGTAALRGLAHPLRGRILDQLLFHGPATATILGERLGESSGSTSYHLRQLARYGFIETDPGHSGGRERWWRARPGGWWMRGSEYLDNPETRPAAEAVLGRYFRGRRERFQNWNQMVLDHPKAPDVQRWKTVASDSNSYLRLTPEEAAKFRDELYHFVRTWVRDSGVDPKDRTAESHPDTEVVEVQMNLFPLLRGVLGETPPDQVPGTEADLPAADQGTDSGGTH